MNVVRGFAEISRPEKLRVIWGFCWRGLLTSLATLIASLVVGFVLGFVGGVALAVAGLDVQEYMLLFQAVGFVAGLIIGMCSYALYVPWMFASRLGTFRLKLVTCAEEGSVETTSASAPA